MVIIAPPGAMRDRRGSPGFHEGIYDFMTGIGVPQVRSIVLAAHFPDYRIA
jgi:hypothetical protein